MPKDSKEFDRRDVGRGAPVEGDIVDAGNDAMPTPPVDVAAQERTHPAYLNAAYPLSEDIEPSAYRERALFDALQVGPRQVLADRALRIWARALRRFARAVVWATPIGAICIAVGAAGGWPTPAAPTDGNPGMWLILTLSGLILVVIGVVGLASLMAPTDGGPWAAGAVVALVAGSLLLAPVLGLVAVARPAGPRLADGAAAQLEAQVMQTASVRWLGVSGLALIAVAGVVLACGILATRILNRADGWLVLFAVALAVTSAYAGWQFLLVLAGMALLAAALGLAWTASRLTPDGALVES
jgi:hypothetical protein